MTIMPLFSYQTTIVLIDDDQLFLKSLNRQLNRDYSIKTFHSSKEALSFFKDYKPILSSGPFLRGCSEHEILNDSGHIPVDLNSKALEEFRKNPNRIQDVSVVIVDYKMPDLDGLEFCMALQGLPIKKILLTGAVDYPNAIQAFNKGIIDRYIRKDNLHLIEEINQHIVSLMSTNLIEKTRGLLTYLETDSALPASDPLFVDFFKEWCFDHEISEYFLLDKQGNFVVTDVNQNVFYFVVHTDRTLSEFIEFHEEDKEIKDLIGEVSKRKLIPFFEPGCEPWKKNGSEWDSHFYVPNVFEGNERYYWALVKGKI